MYAVHQMKIEHSGETQ